MFQKIWDAINGHKMNTGLILVVVPPIMSQAFGISNDEAVRLITGIMTGLGCVVTVVGYVHKIVKSKAAK